MSGESPQCLQRSAYVTMSDGVRIAVELWLPGAVGARKEGRNHRLVYALLAG